MKQEAQKKAKFYQVLTKTLKFGGLGLIGLGVVAGIVLMPTVGLATGAITLGCSVILGTSSYYSSKISEVYENGYKAEVANINDATMEDFKLEATEKVQNQTNTYTYSDSFVNTNEDEITK